MTNTSDAVADSTNTDVSAILLSNTFIADAMGYSALPTAYKTELWSVIDATWAAGHVPTVSAPAAQFSDPAGWTDKGGWNAFTNTPTLVSSTGTENDMYFVAVAGTTNLDGVTNWTTSSRAYFKDGVWMDMLQELYLECTQAEAQTIYASHVAHALWLEHNLTYPWRLASYSLEECSGLFDPTVLFWSDWNTGTTPYLEFAGICDYDPYGTQQLVETIFTGYTHTSAKRSIGELLDRIDITADDYGSVHHNTSSPSGMALTPAQHFSTANEWGPSDLHVSRRGCHTGGPLVAALGRSINLPTREHHGILTGGGHHSMEFLSIRLPPRTDDIYFIPPGYDNTPKGAILGHGDDIYSAAYNSTMTHGIQKLVPRGYYEDWVFGQAAATINLQAARIRFNYTFETGLPYWAESYDNNGWTYIYDTLLEPYLNQLGAGADVYYERIHKDLAARNGEVYP